MSDSIAQLRMQLTAAVQQKQKQKLNQALYAVVVSSLVLLLFVLCWEWNVSIFNLFSFLCFTDIGTTNRRAITIHPWHHHHPNTSDHRRIIIRVPLIRIRYRMNSFKNFVGMALIEEKWSEMKSSGVEWRGLESMAWMTHEFHFDNKNNNPILLRL